MRNAFCLLTLVALLAPAPNCAAGEPLSAAGITEPFCDVALSVSVPGIVSVWKLKEGDLLKKGDVILELDKRLEALESARRKAVLDNRKSDFEALQKLFTKSSISVKKEELDKAETEYRIATAEYEIAVEQLSKRSVAAPCYGTIVEIKRHPGEACQAYEPLIRIVDTRQCYFVSNLEAKDSAHLQPGQSVELDIEGQKVPIRVQGRISFVSPVVDPASGLQKVKAVFENRDGKVRPGLAGKMLFSSGTP